MFGSSDLSLLIVDDSPEDRFAARIFLSESPFRDCTIHEAESGAKGLAAMRQLRPDCVLLDYRLADMSGFDVLDQIKDAYGDPIYAVVMLTGSGDEALAASAMRAGAQDYLPKGNINAHTLPQTIQNAIERFELIQSRRGHEERLRLFIDRTPVAVAMFDADMRFMTVSHRFIRDAVPESADGTGLVGRNIYDVMPNLPAQWRAAHRRVLAGETLSEAEDRFVRADGQVDWWHWEMTPWFETTGEVGGVLLFAERINARKEAETAMRLNEERLRISQEAGGIGTWEWDVRTGKLFWSDQQYALYGLDPDRTTPINYDEWLQRLHADDRQRMLAEVSDALAGQADDMKTFDFRILSPDGKIRWLHARAEIKRAADGSPVSMIGVNIDITERRETEQALRRLTETLEKRVAEEVSAREAAHAQLQHAQRMEALGQLAGGIAHDFNNVLQAVSGGLALISRRADDPNSVRRFSAMAADAAQRGAAITGRLLTFSRTGELNSEAVSPRLLLDDQREILFHTLGRSVVLTVEADHELPSLLADKAQLETVLVNLAVNARDAMPDGGALTLRAWAETVTAQTVHPAGLAPGEYVAVSVIDTGTGMDASTLARASEPFFTTKPVGKGTGLGLAMARGFAQQSGGGFAIASQLGIGTTITLWFPVSDETTALCESGSIQPAVVRSARILAVDDDPLVNDVVAGFLIDQGYEVTQSLDGFAALAHFDTGATFDLLITDFAMPGMNGLVLIEEARLRRPDLPVLLLTGYMDAGTQADVDRQLHDITGVLRKPFGASDLLDRVAELLRQGNEATDDENLTPDIATPDIATADIATAAIRGSLQQSAISASCDPQVHRFDDA